MALGTAAYAQDFAAAGQHFASAQEAFAKADYGKAAREYQAAYDITQDPSLLMNIGESWQRAGNGPKAAAAYRAFLGTKPAATDREEVERRLRALDAAGGSKVEGTPGAEPGRPAEPGKAEPVKDIEVVPPTPVVPGEPYTGTLRTVAWGGVALTVALVTAGAVLGLGAQNRADELERRTTAYLTGRPPVFDESQRAAYDTLRSEGQAYNTAAIACFAVGGAAAVASAALFIADWKKAKASPRPSVALLPGSVQLGWRF